MRNGRRIGPNASRCFGGIVAEGEKKKNKVWVGHMAGRKWGTEIWIWGPLTPLVNFRGIFSRQAGEVDMLGTLRTEAENFGDLIGNTIGQGTCSQPQRGLPSRRPPIAVVVWRASGSPLLDQHRFESSFRLRLPFITLLLTLVDTDHWCLTIRGQRCRPRSTIKP